MLDDARVVHSMAFLRVFAGSIEVTAALLMLRFGQVKTACQINAILGLIGPVIFITVSFLGLAGLAGKIAPAKLLLVAAGVFLILIGTR